MIRQIDNFKVEADQGRNTLTVASQDLLNVNISSSFIEVALSMAKIWNKEGDRVLQKARGAYAPYSICNRTGSSISVWTDTNPNANAGSYQQTKLDDGASVEWRFEDWKKMREVR